MKTFFSSTYLNQTLFFLATFVVILTAAKYGQYLYYEVGTYSAVLWPPTGIALAIIWLRGYIMAVPVLMALLTASLTGPGAEDITLALTLPLAQVSAHLAGIYLLRVFNFNDALPHMRDVLIFFGVLVIICGIAPSVTSIVMMEANNLSVVSYGTLMRDWAGYFFSGIIFFPIIISLIKYPYFLWKRSWRETFTIIFLVLISVCLFYIGQSNPAFVFPALVIFLFAHFWICLRFTIQAVAFSLGATTVYGVTALYLSSDNIATFNQQLFSFELFMFMIIPLSYAFAVLVKERDRTIIDLQKAMDRIVKENVTNNDFMAVLAHELRNPLAPVKTTLEILNIESTDPGSKEMIQSAHKQIHSMKRLLDDLLDVARMTQGKFKLQKERVNLCQVIKSAVRATEEKIKEKNHQIVMKKTCDDAIWLEVDPVRFEQVLINLLNNAAKYTDPGGVIEINYQVEKNNIQIIVSDNGQGIDSDYLEKIFTRFWQIRPKANTDSGSGIGVGLSLTKEIVEMHGGKVWAESEGSGKGSRFVVILPITNQLSETVKAVETKPNRVAGYKVLVVDDNQAAANSMAKLLTLKGYESLATYTALDALIKVESFQPDLILLDIGLPDINGYELAARLRRADFTNKIIAVSGYGQPENIKKALDSGCDQHFTKPMSIRTLEAYLHKEGL